MNSFRRLTAAALTCLVVTVAAIAPASAAPKPTPSAKSTPAKKPATKPKPTIPPAPRVKCAKPAKERVPQLPWAQDALTPDRVWNLTRGAGVIVAVLGTGVDASVPQLKGHVRRGVNVAIGGRKGPADTDCVGTGTFAAGIVAAQRVEGVGFTGVAPGASVLPVRVARDGEQPTAAGLAAGIDAAVAGGAKVIAVAVEPVAGSTRLARAVRNALARDVVVVAPAGVESTGADETAFFPAAYPKVVSVASSDLNGTPVTRVDGPGGVRVDLAAPGKDLVSLGIRGPGQMVGAGDEYAAAFVAGTAALVRAYYPRFTVAQVTQRLENSATRPGTPVPDPSVGWGVVNPYEAVSTIAAPGRGAGVAPSVTLPPRVIADGRAGRLALLLIGGIGAVVILVAVVGAVIVAGRRRGWQAGGTH